MAYGRGNLIDSGIRDFLVESTATMRRQKVSLAREKLTKKQTKEFRRPSDF